VRPRRNTGFLIDIVSFTRGVNVRMLIVSLALIAAACQSAVTPTAASAAGGSTTGFFNSGDVRLHYRLDIPQGQGPFGAVVFGHGSGLQTKDSCRFLADGFLQRRFATLCFDKRGVGQSAGTYVFVGARDSIPVFDDLANDMAAGVAFLRTRSDIDPNRIGLAGVSQAGWIIPLAAQKSHPAFMVLMVGPTVSVGIEGFYSRIVEETHAPVEEGYKQLPLFDGFHGFDPKPVLGAINVPGLWLLGGEDRSIPTPATVAILDQLIAAGKPYSRVVFPGFGHNLGGAPFWPEIDRFTQSVLH
jgi:pimeloyl-ACP methyl ester carboxylesterase